MSRYTSATHADRLEMPGEIGVTSCGMAQRRVPRLGEKDRRDRLDEGYVMDAMARQIEEIRSLPEFRALKATR